LNLLLTAHLQLQRRGRRRCWRGSQGSSKLIALYTSRTEVASAKPALRIACSNPSYHVAEEGQVTLLAGLVGLQHLAAPEAQGLTTAATCRLSTLTALTAVDLSHVSDRSSLESLTSSELAALTAVDLLHVHTLRCKSF